MPMRQRRKCMWIADGWEDYELLDCGGGEKLERWGKQILGAA